MPSVFLPCPPTWGFTTPPSLPASSTVSQKDVSLLCSLRTSVKHSSFYLLGGVALSPGIIKPLTSKSRSKSEPHMYMHMYCMYYCTCSIELIVSSVVCKVQHCTSTALGWSLGVPPNKMCNVSIHVQSRLPWYTQSCISLVWPILMLGPRECRQHALSSWPEPGEGQQWCAFKIVTTLINICFLIDALLPTSFVEI